MAKALASQSPQIGSMFLTFYKAWNIILKRLESRNPLKSGQCFLLTWGFLRGRRLFLRVAIPSNRVNVSYGDGWREVPFFEEIVAIPSNRVNVSYTVCNF